MKYSHAVSWLTAILIGSHPIQAAADPIHVGVVPQFDLRRINTVWSPLLARLEQETGLSFQLDIAPSIPAFERSLNEGVYDIAYMNPYHFVVANRSNGYQALIRDHAATLSGIVVVAKDSPIDSVEKLNGKIVAFPSPNAMGAALVPRAEFARKFHITVVEKYVKSHSSVYLNVALGQADAGGGVHSTFNLLEPQVRDKLRILYETESYPPHPLAVHPRVPEKTREAAAQGFLKMAAAADGAALIAEIPMKKPGRARTEDYAPLTNLGLDAFYVVE